MPAIYQCLRFSLRRRPYQSQQIDATVISPTSRQELQQTDYADDEDDIQDNNKRMSSPLPIITDRGPPGPNRYRDADIFWNSTMMEADKKDKAWPLPSRPGNPLPEDEYTGRSRLPTYGFIRDTNPEREPQNSQGPDNKPLQSRAATVRRRLDTSYGSRNDERKVLYGRERAENDLTVMYFAEPGYPQTPFNTTQQRPPNGPPIDTSEHAEDSDSLYTDPPPVHVSQPEQKKSSFEKLTSTSHLVNDTEGKTQQSNHFHAYSAPIPSLSSVSQKLPSTLTWNADLNKILRDETVDPVMKERVRERAKSSNTKNGIGEVEDVHVAAIEAGLVPNFSYPVAGSAFYERTVADSASVLADNKALTHGTVETGNARADPQTSTDQWRLEDFDFDFDFEPSYDVPSPSFASTSKSPSNRSTSPTSALPSRQISGTEVDDVSNRLNSLLTNVLSPSELNLLNEILATASNTITLSPQLLQLIKSLHGLLFHLQDRTLYLEDNLLPRLGTALERKTFSIDVLSLEIRNLGDQITQLRTTVDFSTKILAGCWMREYEMWRTLTGIQEGRRRWWNRRKSKVPAGVLSPDCGQRLSGRELDALMLMAEQNVGVLREDVEDMAGKVEDCKRSYVAFPSVDVEEGSWRDV